jgi:hypothetical protein
MDALVTYVGRTARRREESTRPGISVMGVTSSLGLRLPTTTLPAGDDRAAASAVLLR